MAISGQLLFRKYVVHDRRSHRRLHRCVSLAVKRGSIHLRTACLPVTSVIVNRRNFRAFSEEITVRNNLIRQPDVTRHVFLLVRTMGQSRQGELRPGSPPLLQHSA